MQLDKFTDYALRILMVLAVRAPERLPVSAIARLYGLSEHHLAKVGAELTRQGFVASERGRTGGLTLARAPEQINIGAVVRALKSDDPVVECFGTSSTCILQPACGLRGPFAEAREAFFAALDGYTLADVTRARGALADLLAG
ncbi:RrF2 family transcriptional regulator [Alterinioella nitratireducens]|jgi:Rrf2 family nitric oxide-sensitive transcriptional repressor|uniref:RrF2 family transcriptional regulator n=1 Tax=Alterinioella nitratireducens TaxID=2735915 RepID=UPI000C46D41E|nr:Rrf2 family transcriptional regulator [Alterinioella nitratireducens]MAN15598.1 transcriptional regulator [Dinoroseobacter sp.]MAX72182.1 transcriptional regulator [Nioella sp.]NPD19931.1 Rrf2 family transcriptional regulator [Alterinioella nitratireducens]